MYIHSQKNKLHTQTYKNDRTNVFSNPHLLKSFSKYFYIYEICHKIFYYLLGCDYDNTCVDRRHNKRYPNSIISIHSLFYMMAYVIAYDTIYLLYSPLIAIILNVGYPVYLD